MFLSTATLPLGKSTLMSLVIAQQAWWHWPPLLLYTGAWTLVTQKPICDWGCFDEIRSVPFLQRLCVPSKKKKKQLSDKCVHPITPMWGGAQRQCVTNLYWLGMKGGRKAMKTAACRKRSAWTVRRSACACWALSTVQPPCWSTPVCPAPRPLFQFSPTPGEGWHCSRLLATCLRWVAVPFHSVPLLCSWRLSLQK